MLSFAATRAAVAALLVPALCLLVQAPCCHGKRTVTLHFTHFWKGFDPQSSMLLGVFVSAGVRMETQVIVNQSDAAAAAADILIYSVFDWSKDTRYRLKHHPHQVTVLFSGENCGVKPFCENVEPSVFDYQFGFAKPSETAFRFPLWLFYYPELLNPDGIAKYSARAPGPPFSQRQVSRAPHRGCRRLRHPLQLFVYLIRWMRTIPRDAHPPNSGSSLMRCAFEQKALDATQCC